MLIPHASHLAAPEPSPREEAGVVPDAPPRPCSRDARGRSTASGLVGQVAWRLGVSVRAYRELEAGERPDPLHVGAAWTTPRCLEFYDLTVVPNPLANQP